MLKLEVGEGRTHRGNSFCRGNKFPFKSKSDCVDQTSLMDTGCYSSASRERSIIERGLVSFHDVTCIRFVRRTNQRDYLNIMSDNG